MAYLPLSTANLPDPAINPAQGKSPEDYFDVFTWTGTGNTGRSFTDLSFQPDLVWAKDRTNAYGHVLFDSVRGAGADKELGSQVTGAEGYASTSTYDYLSSFDSNGFTSTYSGSNFAAYFNNSGDSYVAWNWKANGTGVSNTDGSITSTVSANTDIGFSIVSYTGTGSNATVGHGLDSALDMLIVKNRDRSANWHTWHNELAGTQFLELSSTAAAGTDAPSWNSTVPSSTVFSVGTSNSTNASGEDLIAYCFHSVEGFSKFGSYTGNGSTDGAFVYTGFRPAFLLLKVTSTADDWIIWDGVRSPENLADNALKPNSSAAEVTGNINNSIDLVSNGFKCRNTNEKTNFSGYNYIYMAFAENPFKYSNAR